MNRGGGSSGQASIPMNLFATWEIDRSSSNCIPRICSMSICRLSVIKELDKDIQTVFIAVKMQGSKRVFRSNEIYLASSGLADTMLEITFSLQYPHFVKRNENRLQLMLQRKKRYKNRAMLGYKTLAVGRVDMGQIIQCPIVTESTIDLYLASGKENEDLVLGAQITVLQMSSIPIDADIEGERSQKIVKTENFSDDDEDEEIDETYSSDQDIASDNPQEFADEDGRNAKRKTRRKVRMSSSSRQQNFIKSKVAALLKKFKQVADEGLEPGLVQDPDQNPVDPVDYDFYDEIEDFNFSDSCPELDDNCSIVSTPKPKLRPFFDRLSHSSSQTEISSLRDQTSSEQMHVNSEALLGNLDYPPVKEEEPMYSHHNMEAKNCNNFENLKVRHKSGNGNQQNNESRSQGTASAPNSPKSRHVSREDRKWCRSASFREGNYVSQNYESNLLPHNLQFSNLLEKMTSLEDQLPRWIILVDGSYRHACHLVVMMGALGWSSLFSFAAQSIHDVRTVFASITGILQKYVNSNSNAPDPVKIVVFGTEAFLNTVLRQYVEHLSAKPLEWQSFFIFHLIPLGTNRVARYLGSVDPRYSSLFIESSWRESLDKLSENPDGVKAKNQEVLISRVKEYLMEGNFSMSLPVAEAMMTFRQTSGDEDNTQTFLPFISDVKVGENDLLGSIQDSDKEEINAGSSSQGPPTSNPPLSIISPPVSPSITTSLQTPTSTATNTSAILSTSGNSSETKLGLQVDYWKEKDISKYSLKNNFKSFHVSRLPANGERATSSGLSLDIVTKGKKMIMRLPGKKGKEKESESKTHIVGSISRILCSSKHHQSLLRIKIDGVEWRGIKYFQISSHWSSHVKFLPVAIFTHINP